MHGAASPCISAWSSWRRSKHMLLEGARVSERLHACCRVQAMLTMAEARERDMHAALHNAQTAYESHSTSLARHSPQLTAALQPLQVATPAPGSVCSVLAPVNMRSFTVHRMYRTLAGRYDAPLFVSCFKALVHLRYACRRKRHDLWRCGARWHCEMWTPLPGRCTCPVPFGFPKRTGTPCMPRPPSRSCRLSVYRYALRAPRVALRAWWSMPAPCVPFVCSPMLLLFTRMGLVQSRSHGKSAFIVACELAGGRFPGGCTSR